MTTFNRNLAISAWNLAIFTWNSTDFPSNLVIFSRNMVILREFFFIISNWKLAFFSPDIWSFLIQNLTISSFKSSLKWSGHPGISQSSRSIFLGHITIERDPEHAEQADIVLKKFVSRNSLCVSRIVMQEIIIIIVYWDGCASNHNDIGWCSALRTTTIWQIEGQQKYDGKPICSWFYGL